jgi:two-component system OmpR family response regulator
MIIKGIMCEDDVELSSLLISYLKKFNISISSFVLPEDVLRELKSNDYDILILDLTLPQMDGLDLCKKIREFSNIPIIISSARDSLMDKVIGLEIGADDYLPKPYDPRELVARIKANLRKVVLRDNQKDFVLDEQKMEIRHNGEELQLTTAEYEVFALFIKNPNIVLTRDNIVDSVESMKWESVSKSVDVIVGRIRHKIGDNPKNPKYIKSIKGMGYKFLH